MAVINECYCLQRVSRSFTLSRLLIDVISVLLTSSQQRDVISVDLQLSENIEILVFFSVRRRCVHTALVHAA